jgi:hypothetical protein
MPDGGWQAERHDVKEEEGGGFMIPGLSGCELFSVIAIEEL